MNNGKPSELGILEIADDAGNVIDKLNRLRLGPGLTLSRNDNDPSYVIDVIGGLLSSVVIVDNVAALRGMIIPPSVDKVYWTKNYYATDDTGGMAYRWISTDTTTDDGVLHIKRSFSSTGRFQPIRPTDGMMDCQACGPALANVGTITRSFDPTGSIRIDFELQRVTGILRNSGWSGIVFGKDKSGNGSYVVGGSAWISESSSPWQPFVMRGVGGATLACYIPNNSGAINVAAVGEISFNTAAYGPRTWTQTIQGGERVFAGVANVVGLSVGDTVVVRIGADPTDASGVCASYYFGTIKTITPGSGTTGTIETWESCPEPTPAGVGINLYRTQTQHDMIKCVGFQDFTTIEGFTLDSVQFDCLMYRSLQIDCNWSHVWYNCINTEYGIGLTVPRIHVQTAQGNTSVPGNFIVLASTYATHIGQMIISDISPRTPDTLFTVISEEASCRGTRIDYAELTWNANNAFSGDCGFATQTPGQNDMISVGMLVMRGATHSAYVGNSCTIECLDIKAGPLSYPTMNLDGIRTLIWKGALYRNKITRDYILPASANGSASILMPIHGITVGLRVRLSSTTGVTNFQVAANNFSGEVFDEMFEITANQWCSLGYVTVLTGTNGAGYNALAIRIICDGTVPPGTYAAIEHTCFESDLTYAGALAPDTSPPRIKVSSGPPSFNSDFLGQTCFDSTNSRWYRSVSVGSGAADWVLSGSNKILDGTSSLGSIDFTGVAAPSTPASAHGRVYVDSTSKNLCVKKDDGFVSHCVNTKAFAASKFLSAIDDSGVVTVTQPSSDDLSDIAPVALTNADATIVVGGGSYYKLAASTLTGLHTLTLGNTGAVDKQAIQVRVYSQGSNYLINDSAASLLLSVASGTKVVATFVWATGTGKFQLQSWNFFT